MKESMHRRRLYSKTLSKFWIKLSQLQLSIFIQGFFHVEAYPNFFDTYLSKFWIKLLRELFRSKVSSSDLSQAMLVLSKFWIKAIYLLRYICCTAFPEQSVIQILDKPF